MTPVYSKVPPNLAGCHRVFSLYVNVHLANLHLAPPIRERRILKNVFAMQSITYSVLSVVLLVLRHLMATARSTSD